MKILTIGLAVNILALNGILLFSHFRKGSDKRLLLSEVNLLMEQMLVNEAELYSNRFIKITDRLSELEKPLPVKNVQILTSPAILLH